MSDAQRPHPAATGVGELSVRAVRWPEVELGTDLVELLAAVDDLRSGDVLVVTSKVVSKAEGRRTTADRATAVADETRRTVARRGATCIVQSRLGLVTAAAGVDASNTAPGTVLLLPLDPDATARRLREGLLTRTGRNVAVVVSDTTGRAWRIGQVDVAIGCAGIAPVVDLRGTVDTSGAVLQVTMPALADEVAAAADVAKGKAGRRPVAVVRGLSALVLPPTEHGPGAAAILRDAGSDLFGLGTRDAVVAAVRRDDPAALAAFPPLALDDPDPFDGLLEHWAAGLLSAGGERIAADLRRTGTAETSDRSWSLTVVVTDRAEPTDLLAGGRLLERADALAAAHRLRSASASPPYPARGWSVVAARRWAAP